MVLPIILVSFYVIVVDIWARLHISPIPYLPLTAAYARQNRPEKA